MHMVQTSKVTCSHTVSHNGALFWMNKSVNENMLF